MQGLAKTLTAASLFVASACVQAATFNLNLTGTVAAASTSSFDIGSTHYDQWILNLSGLDAGNAITLVGGDVVNAIITLDTAYTLPASVDFTSFLLILSGTSFPATDTSTSSTTDLTLAGAPVLTGRLGGASTGGQLATGFGLSPPDNTAYTFDGVAMSFTIDILAVPATVDSSLIYTTLFSPAAAVPEPSSYALMLAGMAALGFMLRRRQSLDGTLA